MTDETLATIWASLGGAPSWPGRVVHRGRESLPSWFAVSDLASASIGAAGLAMAELVAAPGGAAPGVRVDRRLASLWFGCAIVPEGWDIPPAWDPLAGDFETRDGWIKLHTNAPHHRAAALSVLAAEPEREAVAARVRGWDGDDLEEAIVAAGGCAALMRSEAAWAGHPQGAAVAAEPLVAIADGGAGPASGWEPARSRPLRGVRVLDLTRVLAGPVATRFLAGFGAEVLRIDPPDWDEPGLVPDVALGKRCARLDLRLPEGRATFEALLRRADILVHGYRPGALDGLGFDEARRRDIRPGLVEVSLDAYGWTGPWRGRRGFDSLVQMSSGLAETGMRRADAATPRPLPVQALDHATGYLMAAAAVRGLTRRLETGRGTIARASLARTASLLASLPRSEPETGFAATARDDLAPQIEETSWGRARRLRPACDVADAPMDWDRPATALGSAAPMW